jgi:hypothetical protein
MNARLWPLLLATLATSAIAQLSPARAPPASHGQVVASPNRLLFNNLAVTPRPPNVGGKGELVIVDTSGKPVGRYAGAQVLVFGYGQQLIGMRLLGTSDVVGATGGGFTWGDTFLSYASADCSGTGYPENSSLGTRYNGWPTLDNGQWYILVTDPSQSFVLNFNSVYVPEVGCLQNDGERRVSPPQAIVPASDFGTPPFFLK